MIEGDENACPLVPSAKKRMNGKRPLADPVAVFEKNAVLTPPIELDDPEDDARPRLVVPNNGAMTNYRQTTAAVTIQIWWKGIIARRQLRKQQEIIKESTRRKELVDIRTWWKRISAFRRKELGIVDNESAEARRIEAWYTFKRGVLYRRLLRIQQEEIAKETARRKTSVVIIENRKAIKLRRRAKKEREAMALARKKQVAAVVVIEGWWKRILASRQAQLVAEDRRRQAKAATQIQAWWKGAFLRRQLRMEQAPVLELRRRMDVTRRSATVDQKIAIL